jgi:endonuclease-8
VPEGDSIWLSAQKLRPVLDGEVITFADARHQAVAAGLEGATCGPLETLGKHLLLTFDGGSLDEAVMLRVHLGMKGSWRLSDTAGRRPGNFDRLGLVLETALGRAALSFPLHLDRFRARDRNRQEVLRRLGPDLLDHDFSPLQAAERAIARAREEGREHLALHQVLLDQSVACGIGNVYKSETLFLERQYPFARVVDTDIEVLARLYARAARLMRANLKPQPRNTTGRARPRTWVYDGHRRGCLRCGTPIAVTQDGESEQVPRTTWWCPSCQTTKGPGPAGPSRRGR